MKVYTKSEYALIIEALKLLRDIDQTNNVLHRQLIIATLLNKLESRDSQHIPTNPNIIQYLKKSVVECQFEVESRIDSEVGTIRIILVAKLNVIRDFEHYILDNLVDTLHTLNE